MRWPRPSPSVCPASNAGLARRARERPSRQAVRHASISTTRTCCAPASKRRGRRTRRPRRLEEPAASRPPRGTLHPGSRHHPPWLVKKTLHATERDDAARAAVRTRRDARPADAFVVVDECGGAQRRCAPDARPGMRAHCAPRTHVVQSCCPSLSAVRTPEPRRGFPTLREGFSPTARGAYRMYCSLSISPQSPQAGGTPALPGRTWCDHAAHRSQRGERQSPAGASPRSGRASARTSNVAPVQAGFALESRGLVPDGTRRIPDLLLTLHQVRRK